jgi:hypothetical protein
MNHNHKYTVDDPRDYSWGLEHVHEYPYKEDSVTTGVSVRSNNSLKEKNNGMVDSSWWYSDFSRLVYAMGWKLRSWRNKRY